MRKPICVALIVLAVSYGVNSFLGQDPLGAWLNWKVVIIKSEGVEEYFEMIDNHEWIYYDAHTGKTVAGHGA